MSENDSAGSLTISDETTISDNDEEEDGISLSSSEDDISLAEKMSHVHVSPSKVNGEKGERKKGGSASKVTRAAKARQPQVARKVWEGKFPFMVYTWEDVNNNELCTVEVHMPPASISSEFHLELEQESPNDVNPPQSLLIKYRVGASFFDEEAFDTYISDFVENIKDASSMSRARHNKIKVLKEKYSDDFDIQNKFCNMTMTIKLPFVCEDIFNIHDYNGQYDNTGKTFRIFNTEDEDGDIVTAHVLIITLVSKNRTKAEEILRRNTPKTVKKHGVVSRRNLG